jgi:hypothetical protein
MSIQLALLAAEAAPETALTGMNFFIAAGALGYLVWYERKKDDKQWPDLTRGFLAATLLFMCFPLLAVGMGAGLNAILGAIVDAASTIKLEF